MVEIGKWYREETLRDDVDGYVYYFIYDDEPGNMLVGVWFENGDHYETTEYTQLNGVEDVDKHPVFDTEMFKKDVMKEVFEDLF